MIFTAGTQRRRETPENKLWDWSLRPALARAGNSRFDRETKATEEAESDEFVVSLAETRRRCTPAVELQSAPVEIA